MQVPRLFSRQPTPLQRINSPKRSIKVGGDPAGLSLLAPPEKTKGETSLADSLIAMAHVTAKGSPVPDNPAIARCYRAWRQSYETHLKAGAREGIAAFLADTAYWGAMPALADYEGIRDFIACTAHAMLVGAILDKKGAQLLYAAQVALTTLRSQPHEQKALGRPQMITK
jgi:hypothetical protein